MFKKMKFNIGEDPHLSKKVQELLFDMGYGWCVGRRTIKYTGEPFLYTKPCGDITFSDSGYSHFKEHEAEEINIDWLRNPPRDTIELNGKKYYVDELEEALKHINPVD